MQDLGPWEKKKNTLFSGYIMNMWNRADGGAIGKVWFMDHCELL